MTARIDTFDELQSVRELCRLYGVNKMYVFGSASASNFKGDYDDVDLYLEMQDMPPLERGENLIKIWNSLEVLFSKKVDILTEMPTQNPFFVNSLQSTLKLIYERDN